MRIIISENITKKNQKKKPTNNNRTYEHAFVFPRRYKSASKLTELTISAADFFGSSIVAKIFGQRIL